MSRGAVEQLRSGHVYLAPLTRGEFNRSAIERRKAEIIHNVLGKRHAGRAGVNECVHRVRLSVDGVR